MAATVAEVMVTILKASGVRQVYGIPGDSLNGFTDAMRRDGGIAWQHVRHEEAAAFAAAGEAALTGELAVCAGSCGPGNLHLINGLFDANRSRVPVLAIAAHIPRVEIGDAYFQETHPQELFRECSVYCELVSVPEQLPRVLEIAMRTALQRSGVAVVVVPGEVFLDPAPDGYKPVPVPTHNSSLPIASRQLIFRSGNPASILPARPSAKRKSPAPRVPIQILPSAVSAIEITGEEPGKMVGAASL